MEPCHSLRARSGGGTWSVQSLLGGAWVHNQSPSQPDFQGYFERLYQRCDYRASEAATARVSLVDTAGVSHVVATLAATCATAGSVDPLVLLCARDTVLDYFKQAGAHLCKRDSCGRPSNPPPQLNCRAGFQRFAFAIRWRLV